MHQEIVRRRQKLDALFKKYNALPEDDEIRSHWAKYLCILVSGHVEFSIKHILEKYVAQRNDPHTHRYVSAQLEYFTNPKMGRILSLLDSFNNLWKINIGAIILEKEELKTSMNSIVSHRNNISHGRDSLITYVRIKNFYADSSELIQVIFDEIGSS